MKIVKKPDAIHVYDQFFLRFVTSISWRVMFLLCENHNRDLIEFEFAAFKNWRLFLDEKIADAGPYTHHAFLLNNQKMSDYWLLSGDFSENRKFLVVRAGPILIVSRLTAGYADEFEANVWKKSEVNAVSGQVGMNDKSKKFITPELAFVMQQSLQKILRRVNFLHHNQSKKRPRLPRR